MWGKTRLGGKMFLPFNSPHFFCMSSPHKACVYSEAASSLKWPCSWETSHLGRWVSSHHTSRLANVTVNMWGISGWSTCRKQAFSHCITEAVVPSLLLQKELMGKNLELAFYFVLFCFCFQCFREPAVPGGLSILTTKNATRNLFDLVFTL